MLQTQTLLNKDLVQIFEPSHTFDIHGDHYIIGNELGHDGTKIYRVNHTGGNNSGASANTTYTSINGFRLLHDHQN